MHIKFYTKELAKKGDCKLYARINYAYNPSSKKYDNIVKYYTDLRIDQVKWDVKNQCAKKGMIGKAEFDLRITNTKEKIQKAFNACVNQQGREPDAEALKKALSKEFTGMAKESHTDKLRTFWGYFQDFINQSVNGSRKNVNGDPMAPSTIQSYRTLSNHLKSFELECRQRIEFENIDMDLYADLYSFFENHLSLSKNTISKHIRTLKTVIRESGEQGYHNNKRYMSSKFAAPTELTTAVYINEKELQELYKLDLSATPRLDKVRDLFVIGCVTGLRFSDIHQVTLQNIKPDHLHPLDLYLTINQVKTGKPVTIPVSPIVKEILAKYDNQLPNSISNQKTNTFLKEICKKISSFNVDEIIEFTKGGMKVKEVYKKFDLITTHTARRSFATNAFLAGQQAINIMAVTGHQTEKSFLRYIRVTPLEKARLFKLHDDKRQVALAAG